MPILENQIEQIGQIVCRNVYYLRERRGWTQERAGADVGMTRHEWSEIECGRFTLAPIRIVKVAHALGVEPHVLFDPATSRYGKS
jgi:transcriptional regulator with XRE-family HTH domain